MRKPTQTTTVFLNAMLALIVMIVVGSFSTASGQMTEFKNSREGLTGSRLDDYIDFTVKFDSDWTMKPREEEQTNFLSLEFNKDTSGAEPISDQFVGFGTLNSSGTETMQRELLENQLAPMFISQFASQVDRFEVTHKGWTTMFDRDAYSFAARLHVMGEELFLKVVFVPSIQGESGVSTSMLARPDAAGVANPDQLGTSGQMARVLNTVRFPAASTG